MDRRSLLLAMGSAALSACASARRAPATLSPASSFPLSEELDELIDGAMKQLAAVAGLSVAIYSPQGCYTRGFGVGDISAGNPVTADTCFYIASSTKPLTALALASLAARRELDLDTTLASFAPDAPFPGAIQPGRVTFRHLLTHMSGISCDPVAVRLAFSGQHSPEQLWQLLGTCTVNRDKPFGTFKYTNTGYNIATILTDRQSGRPWQDMLEQELFRPAGMLRASARMSKARDRGWAVAKPHAALPEGISRLYLEKTDRTMHSAGGVIMSANDAVCWLELMAEAGNVGGRSVAPESAVLATRAPLAPVSSEYAGYKRRAYGLGWYHVPFRDELMLHHFGSFAGTRSHVSYIPARRIGVAAFANDSTVAAQLTDVIADYVYDRSAGRSDARAIFDARMTTLLADRDRFFARVTADRARRAARQWMLKRAFASYAGRYRNEAFGEIAVHATAKGLDVAFGILHASAEPGAGPDAIRVELVPNLGEFISFLDMPEPALKYNGAIYMRG